MNLFLVAIGGALGSMSRYVLSALVLRATGWLFPAGTFVVNILGCAIFGAIIGAAEQRIVLSTEARALLLSGVLGGFTTFSSYTFESFVLLRDGQWLAAVGNIVGQVVVGLAGFWAAYLSTR
ncbi:MAG: fluoride efflux transporter CrcB [Acidobacteriota bacterium]